MEKKNRVKFLCRWELEDDVLAGEVLVHLGEGVDTVTWWLGFVVEVDLEELGAIGSHSCSLANNLGWEDEVVEDGLVDLCECVLSRPELLKLSST